MVDTFSTGVPISSGYAPDAPRFGTVIEANLNRTFDPIISSAERKFKFGSKQDPKYDFKKYAVGQYAEFSAEFAGQPNDQAAVNLRQQIDRSSANRQTLAMATTAQLLGSAFFDPINYIGLPFGGPALTVGRAALRVGASVGAVETVREGAILATDPLGRYDEAALNVGSSILFGAAIGGLVSAPAVGRAQAFERVSKFVGEYTTLQRANENAANISPEMFMSRISRDQRPFAAMDDATLQSDLLARVGEADDLKARAGDDEGLQDLRDRAVEIERGAGELRQELGLRYIEDSGFKMDDPYGIPANWFTDSVFYKAITTPMKRALQSKYPTTVKKAFFDLAHDMSLGINQNSLGIRSEPSVFLKTAVSHGNMAKMESSLKDLYGQVQQNPMAFDDWIVSASRKRLLGDPNMSEAELKASSVLEDYFGRDVTGKLEEQGLISTPRGRENRIRIINEEIEGLNARRDGASEREIAIIDSRVTALKKDGDMMTRMAMGDYDKLAQYETLIVDIAQWNKTWMANTIKKIDDGLVADRVTLSNLQKVFDERGLTPKQSKLYNDLKARVQNGDDRIANFNNLTDKINAAKTADDVLGIRQELDMTEKMSDAITDLSKAIGELKTRIDNVTSAADKSPADAAAEPFFPRFYNLDKIRQNKEAFTKIIMEEFSKKPYVYEYDPVKGDYVRKELSSDPAMVRARAERTVNNILSEGDPVDAGDVVAGLGRSKHFRHRKLDIPTSAIIDYIELNPVSVLNSYNARVNPRSLFQEKFGKDYFGVATEMELDMIRAGASEADINKMRVDFDSLYRRIVSNVLDRPDAINRKITYVLSSMATFAFMGGAGATSLGDFGRIVMQYELAPMMKGIKSSIDMDTLRMSAQETRMAGSALEYTLGMYRLESQISNNFVAPKLLNSAQQGFYILNGLTPLTIAYKRLSGLVMGHTIMDSSIRFADGTISDFDKMLLLKHGIDEELAIRLAKTPWERNKEGMILPNTEQWADHIEIPEIAGLPTKVKPNFKDMSDDDLKIWFDWLAQETGRKEKVSNPEDWTKAESAAYNAGDFNEFSRLRGYTESEIEEFNQWLAVANEYSSRFGEEESALRLFDVKKTGNIKPKDLDKTILKRVTVIEAREDGTPIGKTSADGRYAPAYYNRETNTIYFDRAYIEGPMFDRKAWLKPRMEGVDALPDIFKTPKQWSNFVMLHEINHSRFSAEDLGIDPVNVAAYENKINQLAMADFKAAKTVSEDDVLRFRVALNSGITNTVIHGTPADRPIITDGVVHIPMSIAAKFGLQEDKFLKGYARVENGFLAMPFQFYNFLFGSMNKTLGAMAHNQVKNRAVGAATMLGLSYMILKMKTNETTFDNMSYQDKMARTIDASGLLPFYSDLFYRTMHSTIALGGPNITGGVIQPKFKQRENLLDVVTDIAGAGPSWAANVAEGIYKVTTGEYGAGASDILRMMPMANMWFLKSEVSELAQALRQ